MVSSVLNKKLLREMRSGAMQFLALVLLCVLGTFLFAGIDGITQMIDATNRRYFEECRLADFWVTLPSADRNALSLVRSVPGVEQALARFSLDMETTLPGEPTLNVTAFDGAMEINTPILSTAPGQRPGQAGEGGTGLSASDLRGCLIQEGFAEAGGLSVGDALTVRYGEAEYSFTVRGLAYSPEFISVTNGIAADPTAYGYILVNARALPEIPLTQIVVRLAPGADAQAAREEIAARLPGAFVVDRAAHRSTAYAQDNVTMFRSLSLVFPLAAFVVAALIVMTTLTRMIDNQRMQIGTLESLGYSSGQIQRHYLAYAVWPSLVGSVLGALIGHASLPPLVWDLLLGQAEYPYRMEPPISAPAWGMVAFSVAMSAGICLATYRRSARESTAQLLRAKPPRAGKRILLERLPWLWGRLGFNAKMVVRNLMRSKMRSFMSLVGLLCCNALLIASMGLQDSVTATAHNHYTGTLSYDVRANLTGGAAQPEAYRARLPAESLECLMERSVRVTALAAGGESRATLLTVVEDGQRLLHLGAGETWVPLSAGEAAMTEKLARTLGAEVGEELLLQLPGDEEPFRMRLGRIVYNNFSQGVYLTRSTWEALRKEGFTPTALLIKGPAGACLAQLDSLDEVDRVDFTRDQVDEALVSLDMVSSIFLLLMVIALALAFVICYNMGLINFAERTREYATLKVLGYHQREIRRLILRENLLLTLAALALSLYPGIALTSVVLSVCETDTVRYVSQVPPSALALSSLITFVFSGLIQRLLARKVRSIVMVEALKSVE